MAFKLNRSSKEPMSEINVTPFVDVMLVLLIIFMVTAPLLTVGVQVDLPESSADSLPEETEPLTLSINAKGEILSKKAFSGKSIYVPDNADAVSIQTIYLDLKNKEPETSNDILIAKAKQQHYTNLFNAGLLRKRILGGIAKLGYGTQGDIVRE